MVLTIRVHRDLALVHLDQILTYHQAHPNPLIIHLRSAKQLSKLLEKLSHLLLPNPYTSVDNVHQNHLLEVVVGHNYPDSALPAKLEGVLDEVDHDLLETKAVTAQLFR